MLPGFRFLFAAIVLSISTLVFGLGAAALLRASHETFASLPALPAAPALPSATADTTLPTLALLRVDTPELDAAAPPRPAPAPVIDHAAPTPPVATETKEAVAAPDHVTSRPTPAPAPSAAAIETEHNKSDADHPTDAVAADTKAAATPAAPVKDNGAPTDSATVAEPDKTAEIRKPSPDAGMAAAAAATDAPAPQAPTVSNDRADVAAAPAEPTQKEPVKSEAARAEPAAPRIPETTLANEPRPAPLEPSDAPIKTAMLAPTDPAPSAIPDQAIAITGPIPLPRSREWALAQGHLAQQAAKARKRTAAVRTRPRAIVRQPVRPQAQAPASVPNLLFPFGQ